MGGHDENIFRVRSSKFRHVYGSPARKESSFECINITKNAHDSDFCAANPKFIAVVTESAGGGSFLVLPLFKVGRVDFNAPKICGHSGSVLDIKWNPFNDHEIASCSEDATIKLWTIPEGGLAHDLTDCIRVLIGHTRRVGILAWHPTASNLLLSASYDHKCILWKTSSGEAIKVIDVHPDTILCVSWNRNGSLFATTCKDKNIRIINPRTSQIVQQGSGHLGSKPSRVLFAEDSKLSRLVTTGFSRRSERQYAIWMVDDLSQPLVMEAIDCSSGVLFVFYDYDTKMIYVAGKGDGNIRFFELVPESPHVHYLSQFQSSSPQRGLGVMPKRGVDTRRCEIIRFYKLHVVKGICEPLSMIVPRKSEIFHEDLYPPTLSSIPSLTADEWLGSVDKDPVLISLKDGIIVSHLAAEVVPSVESVSVAKDSENFIKSRSWGGCQAADDSQETESERSDVIPDLYLNRSWNISTRIEAFENNSTHSSLPSSCKETSTSLKDQSILSTQSDKAIQSRGPDVTYSLSPESSTDYISQDYMEEVDYDDSLQESLTLSKRSPVFFDAMAPCRNVQNSLRTTLSKSFETKPLVVSAETNIKNVYNSVDNGMDVEFPACPPDDTLMKPSQLKCRAGHRRIHASSRSSQATRSRWSVASSTGTDILESLQLHSKKTKYSGSENLKAVKELNCNEMLIPGQHGDSTKLQNVQNIISKDSKECTDVEVRQAYMKQKLEIASLKDLLHSKDQHIKELENELQSIKDECLQLNEILY